MAITTCTEASQQEIELKTRNRGKVLTPKTVETCFAPEEDYPEKEKDHVGQ